ncbi:MAG: protein-L-isoaspartate(D-aspartate) O-methyltransferase [Thermogutta sp.]
MKHWSRNVIAVLTLALFVLNGEGAGQGGARGISPFDRLRQEMIRRDILAGGIQNQRVIAAMGTVPRHEFVPQEQRRLAYHDMALPIGHGQTISPPFVVAYMTEQLDPQPTDRVLEIGTGSGYQAAILSGLVAEVYTIEIVEPLAKRAAETLRRLGYKNVFVKAGDGYQGWPEHAPFDKIIVTCSPENVPQPLVDQLKEGGRMVIPVGERYQQRMYLLKKTNGQLVTESLKPTLFVPMTGIAESQRKIKPDPTKPQIVNGDFEELRPDIAEPPGWYYCKQFELRQNNGAPSGNVYLALHNREPGQPARALQGFPIDGRQVREIVLQLWVRAKNVRPGRTPQESAGIILTFFGEDRAPVGEITIGPITGTFAWQQISRRVQIPPAAREAILGIGMTGATGEMGIDKVEILPLSEKMR